MLAHIVAEINVKSVSFGREIVRGAFYMPISKFDKSKPDKKHFTWSSCYFLDKKAAFLINYDSILKKYNKFCY